MLFCNDSVDANRVLDCYFSSLYILVVAAAAIEQKCKKKDLGYAEVMEEATRLGPKCVQKCSGGMSIVVGSLYSVRKARAEGNAFADKELPIL